VLLYELLAGVAPYPLAGKRPDEVYCLITETEPVRPSAAAERAGKPALTRRLRGDRDAIVLAALRKEAQRRYASVTLLADDVRRFLDGQPVTARGEAVSYRALRFVRRHRLGVGAAAAVLLTLIGGIAATSRQARVAEEQRREAENQRLRAEQRFTDVRKLANSVLFDYHDAIEALPGATAVRERLVKDALAYLDSLAAEAGGDPALQRELAAGYDRMGSVLGRPYAASLGDSEGALDSYQKALRIREALVAADPGNPQIRRELAESHRHVGWQLQSTDFAALREHYRQAIAICAQLVAELPADIERRLDLARSHNEFGTILEDRGDLAGALENERRGLALLEEVFAANRANRALRRSLSTSLDNSARAVFLNGDVAAALESNARALELRAALATEYPTDATLRRMLAISYQNDGDFRHLSGDSGGALASFRRKLAIDEELLAADPANAQAHADVAYSCQRLGDILAARGAQGEALVHYRRSADEYHRSMRLAADTTGYLRVALSQAGAGRAQANLGRRTAALEVLRRAESTAHQAPDDPSNSSQRGVRAETYQAMAEAYTALAVREGTSGADRARADWSAACRMWQQSADVWTDMRRRGILAASDASKPDTVSRELARCKARLDAS
jgi:tetratricopeptide (TPR) repeat protein